MTSKWIEGYTLSSKKPFLWCYDEAKIIIKREFKSSLRQDEFNNDQIDKIIQYISKNNEVFLSNNVEKLRNQTENEGIGKFIYEEIKRDGTFAQAASQLASIFCECNVLYMWKDSRKMKFSIKDLNWKTKILDLISIKM